MKGIVLVLGMVLSSMAHADEWDFVLEPYLLAANIEGDTSLGRATGVDIDVDFGRIMETLRMAAMVRFEAIHDDRWGVVLDYGFMDLGDDLSGPRGGVVEAKLRQGIFEVDAFRRYRNETGFLDVMVGVRWWDNDIDVALDPALFPLTLTREVKADWVDLLVGVRWHSELNERWRLTFSGDVGGFGLEADMTSSLSVGAVYSFNERMELDMRYRGLWVDYEDGNEGEADYFAYDTVTHGPLIGLIIKF